MTWVDALGWLGSALLIYSLLQARILRLRVLNTVACVILIVFNALVGVWPMVAMNVVLAGINIFFIVRMLRERDDDQAYAVLPVHEDDAYLTHFLGVHRKDIDTFFRDFSAGTAAGRGWTVGWTYPSGTSVASLWNGVLSSSGSALTVRNAGHNGSLAPAASATFGFTGNGTAASPGTVTCSLS